MLAGGRAGLLQTVRGGRDSGQHRASHHLAHHDQLLEDVGLLGLLQHDAVGVVDELAVGGVYAGVIRNTDQVAARVVVVGAGAHLAAVGAETADGGFLVALEAGQCHVVAGGDAAAVGDAVAQDVAGGVVAGAGLGDGLRSEDGVAAFVLPGLDQHVGGVGAGVDGVVIKAAVGLGDVLGHQAAVGVVKVDTRDGAVGVTLPAGVQGGDVGGRQTAGGSTRRAVSDQAAGAVVGAHVQHDGLTLIERVQVDVKAAGGDRGQALLN